MKIRNLNQTSLEILLALAACSNTSKETKVAPSPPPAFVVPSQFSQFHPKPAPVPNGPLLQKADRLAICGDSITEQKMYSRIMETYLTVAQPDLAISVRQFGWSGETASGFLARMTNDCLRFQPTVATTCYGMNDHEYSTYSDRIGETYRTNSELIVRTFKNWGVRVILGSAGIVGKVPSWQKDRSFTIDQLNANLGILRNIDAVVANSQHVGFADVYWDMMNARST